MPHALVIEERRILLDDVVDLDGMRVHRLPSGDAFVIAAAEATRDGRPLVGGATRVDLGSRALLRVGGRRLELDWQPGGGPRPARADQKCRLCGGAFASGEVAVACVCDAGHHEECFAIRISCLGCGAPGKSS